MRSIKLFATALALAALPLAAGAQSMALAKQYYDQGMYLEAAKQLRPLADGGNAEAQVMASMMFFEGRGVPKNTAQALKYAKLAANQGNEEGILRACGIPYKTGNYAEAFKLAQHYLSLHPYMKKGRLGSMLAQCYIDGKGTEKNEELGWQMMEECDLFDRVMRDKKMAAAYYAFKMRQTGKDNLEDYADYLFGQRQTAKFNSTLNYIQQLHPDVSAYYFQRAEEGNGFAMATMADSYYDRGQRTRARSYLDKALEAGSAYARSLTRKVNFEPTTYTRLTGNWRYTDRNNNLTLLKIEHTYDKTVFHFNFNAKHGESRIRFEPPCYAICNGVKYMMTSPRTIIRNPRTNMRTGTDNFFTIEFEAIPTDWEEMTLGADNGYFFTGIKHY